MPFYLRILDSYFKILINNQPKKIHFNWKKKIKNLEPEVLMDYSKQHYCVGD